MAYDLTRFSPQSFERFAQSLAAAQFGPSTQIFGAGADGAREATFEGAFTPFAEDGARNGYVVVQAKHLGKSKGDAAQDLQWLKRQANAELKKFKSPRRKLRVPDFYIFVTNVTLTPGAENSDGKRGGTLDQMIAHMQSWKQELGVKEIWIWHADVLSALLDAHPMVRTTFGPWVLAGDVLSAMLESFKAPEFASVIHRVVRNELKDQRGVKTQDSGQKTGQHVHIDQVFVDLPLNDTSLFSFASATWLTSDDETDLGELDEEPDDPQDAEDLDEEDPDWDDLASSSNIVRTIVDRLADKLTVLDKTRTGARTPAYQRLVVLGGPGQGKSTIGQFLAQLLRARLVQAGPGAPPEVVDVAERTIARAAEENIALDGPLRFPIHILLPRYADVISKAGDDAPSLLRFVADSFARTSEEIIDTRRLRDWLSHYPSVIILDGLDEVPRTGNRSAVIREIERLVGDIHEAESDTLIVVTSRPQGYLNDLSRKHWAHWALSDLDPPNAMRFAKRLGEVLVTDPYRRAEIISILSEASEDASTAPLMISPLQVSLLFSLVLTSNNIPKDRWTLFERHYETLRDREIAKGGVNGELIRKYVSQIDRIHYDAGFILQVRAENQGNASAHFTLGEFKALISRNMKRAILDQLECEKVAARILDVATNRLVFLGDRNEGRIAFDVRSLQEFMAAARLMVSPETLIKPRLVAIAYRSHWAHVFRIACSKVYAETGLEEFRDEILAILDRLDGGDDGVDYQAIRAGARLAIALLTDSTAGARETDRAKLMSRALRVMELDLGGSEILDALAAVSDTVTRQALQFAVEENLRNRGGPLFLNTLRLLLILARQEHALSAWARERLNQVTDIQRQDKVALVNLALPQTLQPRDADYFRALIWDAGPVALRRWRGEGFPPPFSNLLESLYAEAPTARLFYAETEVESLRLLYKPIRALAGLTFEIPDSVAFDSGWRLLAAAARFSASPSLETLADAVRLAKAPDITDALISELPWPVASFTAAARAGASETLADQIFVGEFGSIETMLAAERSWSTEGLDLRDAPLTRPSSYDPDQLLRHGPPVRKLRRGQSEIPLSELMDASADWSLDARLSLLTGLAMLAIRVEDVVRLIQWVRPDILAMDWDAGMQRRMMGLIRIALLNAENVALVEPIRSKIPGETGSMIGAPTLVEGVVALLQNPETAEWAALALYTGLPLPPRKNLDILYAVDRRYLITPTRASPTVARAFTAIRALAGQADRSETEVDAEALLAAPAKKASAILRKIYRGQRTNEPLEALTCRAASRALERGAESRQVLIEIISELIASRKSDFDDAAKLTALGLPEDVICELEPVAPASAYT